MSNLTVIWIQKENGKLAEKSRDVYREAWNELPDGGYRIVFEPMKRGYTPTRYKYYFGHVLETILLTCGKWFEIMEGQRFVPITNTAQLHYGLKMKYCPQIMITPFGTYIGHKSTTELPDSDFINQFEETIIAEFSAPPFGCDFMDREGWAEMMKARKRI